MKTVEGHRARLVAPVRVAGGRGGAAAPPRATRSLPLRSAVQPLWKPLRPRGRQPSGHWSLRCSAEPQPQPHELEGAASWEHMQSLLDEDQQAPPEPQEAAVRGSAPEGRHSSRGLTAFGKALKALLPGPLLHVLAFSFPISGLVAIYGHSLLKLCAELGLDLPALLTMINYQGMHLHHAVQAVLGAVPEWASSWVVGAFAWALGVPVGSPAQTWWGAVIPAVLSFAGVLFGFMAIPVLDLIFGFDSTSLSEDEARRAKRKAGYRVVLCMYVPLQLSMLVWALVTVAAGLPVVQLVGLTLSVGVTQGVAINAAHELLHSPHALDRLFSQLLLAPVFYMHWGCSHLAHHVQVATQIDPSSAQKGESFYEFWPRSVWGNVKDAHRIECQRLRRYGQPVLSLHNRWCIWAGIPAALLLSIGCCFGATAAAFYAIQGVLGFTMLELVNYIEHYGLQRTSLGGGRYEKISDHHSWNADWFVSNAILFQLQRHTDHHMHALRPYFALRSLPRAPQLPASYPAMMLLATVPPLWFHVMDPLVDKYMQRREVEVQSHVDDTYVELQDHAGDA